MLSLNRRRPTKATESKIRIWVAGQEALKALGKSMHENPRYL